MMFLVSGGFSGVVKFVVSCFEELKCSKLTAYYAIPVKIVYLLKRLNFGQLELITVTELANLSRYEYWKSSVPRFAAEISKIETFLENHETAIKSNSSFVNIGIQKRTYNDKIFCFNH